MRSTHFFNRFCSAWIPLFKNLAAADMTSSYEPFNL